MLITAGYWLVSLFVFPLLGRLCLSLFDDKHHQEYTYFDRYWSGLIGLIAYLQIISFVLPQKSVLTWIPVILVSLLMVGRTLVKQRVSLFDFKRISKLVRKYDLSYVKMWAIFVVIMGIGIYNAGKTVKSYDGYLYHFNTVAWNKYYPVVPGLANLHNRLGFNSTIHVLAGFVESFLPDGYSAFIVVGGLLTIVSIQYASVFLQKSPRQKFQEMIFSLLLFPYILTWLMSSEMASLSTDIAMMVFSMVFALSVIQKKPLMYLSLLAFFLPTLKLSGVVALGVLPLIAMSRKNSWLVTFRDSGLGLIVFTTFMLRNAIISGYPLYPLVWFRLPFDWQVPPTEVELLSNTIKGWGRLPGPLYLKSLSSGFFFWFSPWWDRVKGLMEIKVVVLAFFVHLLAKSKFTWLSPSTILSLYTFAGIILVVMMAPDIRFGSAYFWIFGAVAITEFILSFELPETVKIQIAALLAGGLIFWFVPAAVTFIPGRPTLWNLQANIAHPPLKEVMLPSGGTVWTPTANDLCGVDHLVCSPYLGNFDLKDTSDIGQGFRPISQ